MVFDSLGGLAARVDDPDLDVAPEEVLVLRGPGPKGAPGMPEAGYIPIPKMLAARAEFLRLGCMTPGVVFTIRPRFVDRHGILDCEALVPVTGRGGELQTDAPRESRVDPRAGRLRPRPVPPRTPADRR